MAEEAKREQLPESPYRVASPEFFFLLQRIDRLDEKFTGLIAAFDAKLAGEIATVRQEVKATEAALRQEMKQEISGLKVTVWTAAGVVLTAFGIVAALLRH